jgi:hypothetical protein
MWAMSKNVGFEVLTAVVMKSSMFWDKTPCSALKVKRRFGGTCRLHLQGRRISQARSRPCSFACHLLLRWFLARLILRPRRWRRRVPQKRRLIFNRLLGVTSQNIEIFNEQEIQKLVTRIFRKAKNFLGHKVHINQPNLEPPFACKEFRVLAKIQIYIINNNKFDK